MGLCIRVNGRGNAWPLELGANNSRHSALQKHPEEYANTSFSILKVDETAEIHNVQWEILFDIGQGIVPFLVNNGNRLPDAVIISHSHFDHICGLYWLVSSYSRNKSQERPLPVYASKPCWEAVMRVFGFLKKDMQWRELVPGQYQTLEEAPGLSVLSFPVFHGELVPGASLLMFEYGTETSSPRKAIFTGDLFCPLLREQDFKLLQEADVIYADANTRFPCPLTNHWSIVPYAPAHLLEPESWNSKRLDVDLPRFIAPHLKGVGTETHRFLNQFINDVVSGQQLCFSLFDFARRVNPKLIQLVHYSGYEDVEYYEQNILDDEQLLDWTQKEAEKFALSSITWAVPKPGEAFFLL